MEEALGRKIQAMEKEQNGRLDDAYVPSSSLLSDVEVPLYMQSSDSRCGWCGVVWCGVTTVWHR